MDLGSWLPILYICCTATEAFAFIIIYLLKGWIERRIIKKHLILSPCCLSQVYPILPVQTREKERLSSKVNCSLLKISSSKYNTDLY